MLSMLGDFWNTIMNTLFRNVPGYAKIIIVVVALMLAFYCIAKTLRLGKQGGDKRPFHIGYFLTSMLFFAIAIAYIVL